MLKTILFFSGLLSFDMCFAFDYPHPKFANPDIRASDNFVTIKAGSFKMGSPASESGRYDDEVQYDVTLHDDFEIQSTLVTQGQFFAVMGYNPSNFKTSRYCEGEYVKINNTDLCPNHPVEGVSWNDAKDFIYTLNRNINDHYEYDLPSEEAWEYSARGGSQAAYWFGSDIGQLGDYVWYSENSGGQTHPVGTKPANAFGLYDAVGSVWQWVGNCWRDGICESRVIRGGSWSRPARLVRSAVRYHELQSNSHWDIGFRLERWKKNRINTPLAFGPPT